MSRALERPSPRLSRLDAPVLSRVGSLLIAYFLAATAVAIVLRVAVVGGSSLSWDEAGYALDAWRLQTGREDSGAYYAAAPGYVQLLSLSLLVFGAGDWTVRLLSLLAASAAVLLCAPLARYLGRAGAAAAAAMLAVAPFWVQLGAVAAPDVVAVALCLLGVALVVSTHLWMGSLVAAAAVAGYLVGFGSTGVWLGVGVMALLVYLPRHRWRPLSAILSLAAFLVTAGAAVTGSFTRPVALPPLSAADAPSAALLFAALLLSAPFFVLVLSLLLMPLLRGRAGAAFGMPGFALLLALGAGVLALAGARLLGGLTPSPVVAALPLTLLAGWTLARALGARTTSRIAAAATVILVLVVSALGALAGLGSRSIAYTPSGLNEIARTSSGMRGVFSRVQDVSLELYRLERSRAEPRGGRGLKVQLAPEMANWGLWYLRELSSVGVYPRGPSSPEVRVLPGGEEELAAGYHLERHDLGDGSGAPGDVVLAWRPSTWSEIDPTAGTDPPDPKASYNLLDAAPPGSAPGQLSAPSDIALDSSGNLYVVDQGNARVQKYAPDGRFLLQWGSEGQGEGQFGNSGPLFGPTGIAATDEYVWVADTWNHRIQQFRPDGSFVRSWGTYDMTEGDPGRNRALPEVFYGPRGIAVGPDGLLYITDTGNKRVVVYDQQGRFVRQWGSAGDGPAELDEPVGIAVSRQGRVYVADARNRRIQVFDSRGRPLDRWGRESVSEGREEPYLDVDRAGNVYVTDPGSGSVTKYTSSGRRVGAYTGVGEKELLTPVGVAVTPRGEVYVVDSAFGSVIHLDEIP